MRIQIALLGDRKTKFQNLFLQTLAFAALFLCAPLPNSATAQDITTGLVGHWKLDEESGDNITDSSGLGHNGTWVDSDDNAITNESITGAISNAISFDGSDDEIEIPHTSDHNPANITYAAWFYVDALGTPHPHILDKQGSGSGYGLFLNSTGGDLYGYLYTDGSINWIGSTSVTTDQWYHAAVTYDGSRGKLYLNGAEVADVAITGTFTPSTNPVTIGRRYNNVYPWVGAIDEVRIYNRALTDDDITRLYNYSPVLPPCNTDADGDGEPDYEAVMMYNNDEAVMQYCNGTEWISVGSSLSDSVQGCPNVGDTCSDGTIYAGLSPDGNTTMYTTPEDAPSGMSWNDDTSNWLDTVMENCTASATSCVSGKANTDLLVALGTSPSPAPYLAAGYCYNLDANGHDDWYLPARDELNVLYENLVDQDGDAIPGGPLGSTFGFNTSGSVPGGWYWSSSEYSDEVAKNQRFDDGYQGSSSDKDRNFKVRCVRKTNTSASGVCTGPEAEPGTMYFNRAEGVLQYCNGANWINMGPRTAEGGMGDGADLSPPAPTSGLAAYWPLDSDANDAQGSNNGTVTGATFVTNGKISGAINLDGTDDLINAGSGASIANIFTGGGTISAWISPQSWGEGGFGRILEKATGTLAANGFSLTLNQTTLNPDYNVAFFRDFSSGYGAWTTPLNSITLNQWNHVVVVYDDNDANNDPVIYINGQNVTISETNTPAGTANTDAGSNLAIGNSLAGDRTFDGLIDDVRIYNSALSEEQVTALYKSNSLAGHWKLDETEGTDATDSSGNGNTGTLNGTDFDESAATGRSGGALSFDGSDDYIDCGTDSSLDITSAITVSAWAYTDADNGGRIVSRHSADRGWMMTVNESSDSIEWRVSTNGSNWNGGSTGADTFEINTWYHVAATYDGTNMRVYIDGNEETSGAFPVALSGPINVSSHNCEIGSDGFSTAMFSGEIDDVRIYNRALSKEEIANLFMATSGDKVDADCTGLGDAHYNDPSTGHCYYRVDTPANFATALANCQADGAYLAEITSEEENNIIYDNLGGAAGDLRHSFFGGSDEAVEGQWRWVSGGPNNGELFFTGDENGSAVSGMYVNNFGEGSEPNDYGSNEDCTRIDRYGSSDWNDEICNEPETYICEKSEDIGPTCSNPYAEGGVMFYNNDEDIMQYCNGEEWVGITGTEPGTIPVPDTTDPVWTTAAGTVATIDTGDALSTTVTATDDSGSVSYSKTSGDAWISVNASTGELTGTAPGSAATYSITVTATDPSGNTAARSFDVLVESATDPCETGAIGTVCTSDGAVYAGTTVGGVRMYAARCDHGQSWDGSACSGTLIKRQWKPDTTTTLGTDSDVDGVANTDAMETAGLAMHPAAEACRNIGATWYLPAKDELNELYTNLADDSITPGDNFGFYIGGVDQTRNYHSSTEDSSGGSAWLQRMSDGFQGAYAKSTALAIRCVRR